MKWFVSYVGELFLAVVLHVRFSISQSYHPGRMWRVSIRLKYKVAEPCLMNVDFKSFSSLL